MSDIYVLRNGVKYRAKDNGDGTITEYVEANLEVGNLDIGEVEPKGISAANATLISPTAGTKSVTTSGTAVALAASTRCFSFLIQPKSTNTDNVFFGSSSVHHTTSKQMVLPPGAPPVTVSAPPGYVLDLAQWYIDATVNGEGVDFVYEV